MSNQESAAGCLGIMAIAGMIASWVGSGIVTWNWLEPDSFGKVILFLIAWSILGKVFDFLVGAVIVGLVSMLK